MTHAGSRSSKNALGV